MTRFIVFFGFITSSLITFSQEKPVANQVELVFTNNDKLRGSTHTGSSTELNWESPLLAHPAELKLNELMYWQQSGPATPIPDDHTARLEMNKGGVLYGKLKSINENHDVALETDYAGPLTVKRSMVRTLTLTKIHETLYQGPNTMAEWQTSNEKAWSIGPKGLKSSSAGTLTRSLPFPKNRFQINTKLTWDNALNFEIIFLSSDINSHYPENCYRVHFNRSRIELSKNWVDKNGKSHDFNFQPSVISTTIRNSEKAEITLFVNREDGQIRIAVNGENIGGWHDAIPRQGQMGDGIHLISSDFPLGIQTLSLTSWDGLLEDPIQLNAERPSISQKQIEDGYQLINLRNNDSLIAKVQAVEDGKVNAITPHGELSVPVSRMKNIALRPDFIYDEAILRNGDVLGHYPNGDTLTFQLLEFQGTKAKITSQNFGETEIDLSIFPHIDFNLYTEHIRQLRRKQN